jgi:hypothetical protein
MLFLKKKKDGWQTDGRMSPIVFMKKMLRPWPWKMPHHPAPNRYPQKLDTFHVRFPRSLGDILLEFAWLSLLFNL